jgi:integrase
VPEDRAKRFRERCVPLSNATLAILIKVHRVRRDEFIFPGSSRGHLSADAMRRTLQQFRPRITVHGFRASFRTWLSEETNFAREVGEKALSHLVGDETERSYDRGSMFDKRRELMQAWSDYCRSSQI